MLEKFATYVKKTYVHFQVFKVGASYVDKTTFDSLAREVAELKKLVLKGGRGENSDYLEALKEENKELKRELSSKERQIDLLIDKIINLNYDKNIQPENVTQQIPNSQDDRFITTRNTATKKVKFDDNIQSTEHISNFTANDIPLRNSFTPLQNSDTSDELDDDNDDDDEIITPAVFNAPSTKKRKPIIYNAHHENDKLYIPSRPKNNLSQSREQEKNVKKQICIIGDSMIQRVKFFDINRREKDVVMYKECTLGATVEMVEWSLHRVLQNKDVDTVIINVGTNNLTSRKAKARSEIDITNAILKAVVLCKKNEVKNVYVSSITERPGYTQRINTINTYLKNATRGIDFCFIDNSNIKKEHLYDNLHLNDTGINILKNNFLGALGISY